MIGRFLRDMQMGMVGPNGMVKISGVTDDVFKKPEQFPHYLIITVNEDDGSPNWQEEREWEIEHDPRCPSEKWDSGFGPDVIQHTCLMGEEISHNGIDSLEVDWTTLEAGRYEVEVWSSYDSFSREYDGGLRLLDARIES
jgi:hypothetical protein